MSPKRILGSRISSSPMRKLANGPTQNSIDFSPIPVLQPAETTPAVCGVTPSADARDCRQHRREGAGVEHRDEPAGH